MKRIQCVYHLAILLTAEFFVLQINAFASGSHRRILVPFYQIGLYSSSSSQLQVSIEPSRDISFNAGWSSRSGSSSNGNTRRVKRSNVLVVPPEVIDDRVTHALDSMRKEWSNAQQQQQQHDEHAFSLNSISWLLFPTVRECNAALAAIGDEGDLLNALRLFWKMRKAATLQALIQSKTGITVVVPAPTLVTYSTLMSRAVRASKPLVALRLWKLMSAQPEIKPDVKAANILMNCYAKVSDVAKARNLLEQMKSGTGPDVPQIKPNLVTYNTLLHACMKGGDLDAALEVAEDMKSVGIKADQRTYTSLIATVARKSSRSAGQHDPSLAFQLLREMQEQNIRPNGMTYSALIDACGRCHRSDLALQGLRIMLRQKAQEQKALGIANQAEYTLPNEIGAWTAAINACGKAGRIETAMRLFYAIPNFGLKPNTITCGCLTDVLLRSGKTAEALEVLRYMKTNEIPPSEVMYTSLMTRAEKLVEIETKRSYGRLLDEESKISSSETKAIEVYTELMKSLIDRKPKHQGKKGDLKEQESNTLLLKVFLVFQEMKAAGAEPDLACYNALLKACSKAGDVNRAQNVLQQMQEADLHPNDISWRLLVQTAGKVRRSDLAEAIWMQGLSYRRNARLVDEPLLQWKPSVESFTMFVASFLREAAISSNDKRISLYRKVVDIHDAIMYGDHNNVACDHLNHNEIRDSQRAMLTILCGIVGLEQREVDERQRNELRRRACAILALDCFKEPPSERAGYANMQAFWRASAWLQL